MRRVQRFLRHPDLTQPAGRLSENLPYSVSDLSSLFGYIESGRGNKSPARFLFPSIISLSGLAAFTIGWESTSSYSGSFLGSNRHSYRNVRRYFDIGGQGSRVILIGTTGPYPGSK